MKIPIDHIMEFASLLVAIFYYPYLRKSYMKWFLPFLAFIFFIELILAFIYNYRVNVTIYFLLSIIESLFYSYIFYQISGRRSLRKMILVFLYISIAAYIIGYLYNRNNYGTYLPILIVSGFLLSIIALLYIYTAYVDDDKILLITEPGFWIAIGVSIFFSATSIVFSLFNFIHAHNLSLFGVRLYNFVPRVLCIVLYSCISIAIILYKKKNKISV